MNVVLKNWRMLKGSITRAHTFAFNPTDNATVHEVDVRIGRLNNAWAKFEECVSRLYLYEAVEGYVDPDGEFAAYEDKFITAKGRLKSLKHSMRPRESTPELGDAFSRFAEQQSTLLQRVADGPNTSRSELPKIRIEPFNGNYKDWSAFKDLFVSAIDSKTDLTNTQKFHYLSSLLKDDAAKLIKHMQVSESSYNTAWQRLNERYDRPRHIVTSYIETFMSLKPVREEDAIGLRKISDVTNEVIRGMEAINQTGRDPWLIFLLNGKLDTDTRRKWFETSRDDTDPTVSSFLKLLDQRCEELELGRKGKQSESKQRTSTSMVTVNNLKSCYKCGSSEHMLMKCSQFLALEVDKRRSFVKEKNLCFNCLGKGHSSINCKSGNRCRTCKRRHHTLTHSPSDAVCPPERSYPPAVTSLPNLPDALSAVAESYSSNSKHNQSFSRILPTAVVNVRNKQGNLVSCRVLLDTASELSYITENCFKRLGLERRLSRIALSGISSIKADTTSGYGHVHIYSRVSDDTIGARVHVLNNITSLIPRMPLDHTMLARLNNVTLADPAFNRPSEIDILLGAGYVWDIFTMDKIRDRHGKKIAISSIFGWVITSILSPEPQSSTSSMVTLVDIDNSLRTFWEIEEPTSTCKGDESEVKAEEHFQQTHRRDANGRYIVQLPFIDNNIVFANTYKGALTRFHGTERRLSKNPSLKLQYFKFMRDYKDLGHMQEIPAADVEVSDGRVFYLPHHPIIGKKLRVVFDGSFCDTDGTSLNSKLHVGSPIQRNLFSVCLRFRFCRFVFSADIIKMFRQIWVDEQHQNFQRILWRENNDEPVKHFRLSTVTYGTTSAPFLAIIVLEQIAKDYRETYPNASRILSEDFYVDDVLTGASSESELLRNRNELVHLLSLCGLELGKWMSNSSTITTSEVVGENELNFLTQNDHSSVVIKFKILFQELWLHILNWDDPLPQHLSEKWINYRNDLRKLSVVRLSRFAVNAGEIHLHGFCDASTKAYSAVVYCRHRDDKGNIKISIVASKTRVAPLKQVSLPRLELCGALLLTRLLKTITDSLPRRTINLYAWSDSTVVLSWLSMQPARLKTFVANRTSEILDTLPRHIWRHVRSKQNPADCASRGITAEQLLNFELWWSGPSWLSESLDFAEDEFKPTHDSTGDHEVQEEVKQNPTTLVSVEEFERPLNNLINRTSSWSKLIRVTAYVLRFITAVQTRRPPEHSYLSFNEMQAARTKCLILAQESFSDELNCLQRGVPLNKKSKLLKLSPYIDDQGILRVGGRIENAQLPEETRHPIILPKDSKITQMILRAEHVKNLHPGVSSMFVIIRQQYWVIGARNLIRKITHDCLKCFRHSRQNTEQRMADLPSIRVRQAYPFENTGCDYAGPFTLKLYKGRNARTSKGYICIFVCMVTSAIHIELVADMTTDSFLSALRVFMARRGRCTNIFSDNGKNFVGGKRKLDEMYQHLQSEEHNTAILSALAEEGIKWNFIPPYSPHWGGIWESAVRSVKLHLKRVIGTTILTFEQMRTLLTQIEAVVNSRPLGATSDTLTHYLSPSHFLIGRPTTMVPEGNLTTINTNRLDYWQHVQCMYQGFWNRWSQEYLTSLQQRPKWHNAIPNMEIHDVVIVKEDNTPPATWVTGRITETFPGKDGLTRVVKIRTSQGDMTRPITKIVKLPIC